MLTYKDCNRLIPILVVWSSFVSKGIAIRHIFQVEQVKQEHVINRGEAGNLVPKGCEDAYAHNPKARESQSCSLGLTRPFVGPLDTWTSIRAMLEARSHKGEVILTHENRIDIAAQWQWRMLKMGYAHTIIVTRGELACTQLRNLFGDYIGCVWFAHSVSYTAADSTRSGSEGAGAVPGGVELFHEEPFFWRLQLAAMILRVGGYNLLMLDTDTMLMDDFYWWMEQPDYKGYHLLSQFDGMGTLNVGVMYTRGTAPSGPTAWSLGEAVLRNVRWKEDGGLLRRMNVSSSSCWDQSVVTDAVYSTLVGRPLFWRCFQARTLDPTWNSREDGFKLFEQNINALIGPTLKRKTFDMSRSGPACHAPFVHADGIRSLEGVMSAPHSGGTWSQELGAPALGELGPLGRAFVKMMAGAGTPMWPDPEDPAAASAAAAIPSERFAYLSSHTVCDWSSCGSNGMYQPQLRPAGEEPCVVIGHVVVSPDSTSGKRFVLAQNGHYSLPLAQVGMGPGAAFFATNPHTTSHTHFGALRAAARHGRRGQQPIPLPRVLTLAPGALAPGPPATTLTHSGAVVLRDRAHMVTVVGALASVAVAAARPLGLPRLSCDYPWMHRGPKFPFNGSHSVPWRYLFSEAFAPIGPSLSNMSCEWYAWVQQGCFRGPMHMERGPNNHINPHPSARMLLSYEMDYLLSLLPPNDRVPVRSTSSTGLDATTMAAAAAVAAAINASAIRTASVGTLLELGRPDTSNTLLRVPAGVPPPDSDGVVNITMAQLTFMLGELKLGAPVVWLEAPMRVVDLPGPQTAALQQWTHQCCGLSWPESYNQICFWNL